MADEDLIEVKFGPLSYEPGNQGLPADFLLGVIGDLSVTVRGEMWFQQPMFPVVELAAAIGLWLKKGGSFSFDTLEASESPFMSIREVPGGCLPEAAWQLFRVTAPLPLDTVRETLASFASEVVAAARGQLRVDVDELVWR